MSRGKAFKKQVRARAKKTGESYCIARLRLGGLTTPDSQELVAKETTSGPKISFVHASFYHALLVGVAHSASHALPHEFLTSAPIEVLLQRSGPSSARFAQDLRLIARGATDTTARQGALEALNGLRSTSSPATEFSRSSLFHALLGALEDHEETRGELLRADVQIPIPENRKTVTQLLRHFNRVWKDPNCAEKARQGAWEVIRSLAQTQEPPTKPAPRDLFAYPKGVLWRTCNSDQLFHRPRAPQPCLIRTFLLDGVSWACVGLMLERASVAWAKACEVVPEDEWNDESNEWSSYHGQRVQTKKDGPLFRLGREVRFVPKDD